MKGKMIAAITLLAIAVMPLAAADIPDSIPTISVSGSAEVSMKPDTAYFSITASFTEETTEEARAKVSEMIGNAAEILTSEFGLSADDLSTSYISASPEYQWKDDERILIGQKAVQTLEITLHDIDSIGPIYDRLMSLSGISISDVTLDKEDKSEEYRQARMEAVRDAYSKAEAFAEAAGVEVGSILCRICRSIANGLLQRRDHSKRIRLDNLFNQPVSHSKGACINICDAVSNTADTMIYQYVSSHD